MKMKTNNNKGFTLIELIMVIVILGILSAVAVPKFFDMTSTAHTKNKAAVIGNIRSGLQLYAANKLVSTGTRSFPSAATLLASGNTFPDILDEAPENWTVADDVSSDADSCYIVYKTGTDDADIYSYYSTGGSSYVILDE